MCCVVEPKALGLISPKPHVCEIHTFINSLCQPEWKLFSSIVFLSSSYCADVIGGYLLIQY